MLARIMRLTDDLDSFVSSRGLLRQAPRHGETQQDRLPALAAELVRRQVAVIFVIS
jgi:hypothetical protein